MKRALLLLVLSSSGCGLIAWPGKACRTHDECAGLQDGYCARAEICTRQCRSQGDCPENSVCSDLGKRSVCLPTCENNEGCAPGLTCQGQVCKVTAPMEPPPS